MKIIKKLIETIKMENGKNITKIYEKLLFEYSKRILDIIIMPDTDENKIAELVKLVRDMQKNIEL